MRYPIAALLLALVPAAVSAQDTRLPDLPRDVESRVRAMRTDARATHLSGPASIGADSTIQGDLVVEGGSLDLAGRVRGDLLVLRGDLLLAPGASVGGDVYVIGGHIEGVEDASVGGTLVAYGVAEPTDDKRADADRRRGDRRRDDDRDRDDWDRDDDDWHRHHDHDDGGLDLGVSIAGNYNRVEGLPILFGPIVETAGPNRLHIAGQAIWRTEPSNSLEDEIGYQVRLDQALFGDRLRIGGDARSLVRAIETRGLNSTEAGLAAVLLHSDLHDYYEEQSWAARLELRPQSLPLRATLTYRDAEHGVLEESDPWSLFKGDDPWRPQPVVAVGDVSTLRLGVQLDTRDDDEEPTRGVYANVSVEHALDQDLEMPSIDLGGTLDGGLRFDDFTTATLDLRAHVPVNRTSTINLRGMVTGTIEEAVLPPQYQSAIGGIGSLPGFRLFEGACGARSERVNLVTVVDGANELSDRAMLPAYGCDRVALAQIEYRGGFDFGHRHRSRDDDDDEWWEDRVHVNADWAFFVDVGRGWSYGDMMFADREDTETMADVGMGVLFDQAGVYVALPLTGEDQSLRVIMRLQRRF